jgi:hypothetical protein
MHFSTLRLGASILVHFSAQLFDWKALLRTQKSVDVHPLISLVGCFGLFNGDRGLSCPRQMTRHLGDSCRLVSTRSLYTCKNLEKLARRVDHSTWNFAGEAFGKPQFKDPAPTVATDIAMLFEELFR